MCIQRESPGGGGGGEEEKEKECTGRDQCGAHTLIQSLSLLFERISLAHTPGAQERAGIPSGAEKLHRLLLKTNCFGKCLCSVKSTSLWNPVLEAQHPGTGAASTSRTIHNLGNNSGGHRQRGAQTWCLRGVWGL